ncbi:MAG: hypothetical protein IJK47_04335 [Lachnospiraceae bacterium]|nr:hypothetical protein [Lachnospiraceae bacterium]
MDKLKLTPEQQLAFDGFIDIMVQIYKMTSDKIDYSKAEKLKDKDNKGDGSMSMSISSAAL